MSSIYLAGDWAPGTREVATLPLTGPLILNLEGPCLENQRTFVAAHKAGPNLSYRHLPHRLDGSLLLGVLANNHAMDFGCSGLRETLEQCARCSILTVGAGFSQSEAEQATVFDLGGLRLGVLSRCEPQFGVASGSSAGVAGMNPRIYSQIAKLKQEVDRVVVSVHAAAELCAWPSPKRQQQYRALIDAGADVVHGHHAHVPQGWETYNQGVIFYGLGNFCIDPKHWVGDERFLWSLTPRIDLANSVPEVEIQTTVVEERDGRVHLRFPHPTERAVHAKYFELCNAPLDNPLLLHGVWQEYCVELYLQQYAGWLGFENEPVLSFALAKQRLLSSLRAAKRFAFRLVPSQRARREVRKQQLLQFHLFNCDSHNDAISTAIGVLSGAIEDRRSNQGRELLQAVKGFRGSNE